MRALPALGLLFGGLWLREPHDDCSPRNWVPDLAPAPEQRGVPLNCFFDPYVELDGAKYTGLEDSYSYKDLPL